MSVRGVLIDYSGTIFRWEFSGSWLADPTQEALAGQTLQALTTATGPWPGPPLETIDGWAQRDLDPVIHRRVFTEALRLGGLTAPGLAEAGYQQMLAPVSWALYPDARAALDRLRSADIPVAVVSNAGMDIRPVFAFAGIDDLVTTFVLSYEEGVMKPDQKLFRIACDRFGVDPVNALMIGDNAAADGGAAALGIAVELVLPLPTAQRPDALLGALARHGL